MVKQEAERSQRDRATLRVIEYFAKPLKITQGRGVSRNMDWGDVKGWGPVPSPPLRSRPP